MTLWLLGWVEVNHELPEERLGDVSTWQPLLSLAPFGHLADDVSDYLFGIVKRPKYKARFPERGVPPDASDLVLRCVADNEKFIAEHGEGEYGHTYATWGEVLDALSSPGAPTPYDDEAGGWSNVVYAVRTLSERMFTRRNPREQVRLVVWANW